MVAQRGDGDAGPRLTSGAVEQIICPKCGAEASSDELVCPRCEAILNEAAFDEEPPSVVEALLSHTGRHQPAPVPVPVPPPAAGQPRLGPESIPRLRGGVDLALSPLPPFEARLLARVDGVATVAEIAARARLAAVEVIAILHGLSLQNIVEFTDRPKHGPDDPVTVVTVVTKLETPLGKIRYQHLPPTFDDKTEPGLPPPAPLPPHLRITAPTRNELHEGPARRGEASSVTKSPKASSPPRPRPRPAPAPRAGPKSSAPVDLEDSLFESSASLSSEGRIVSAPPPPPRPRASDRPAPPAPPPEPTTAPVLAAGEFEFAPGGDDPPLELARDVRPRSTGSATKPAADRGAAESVLEVANALERRGDVAAAIQVLERAIAGSRTPAPLYNRLALALVKRGDLTRAGALLEKALALEPSNQSYRRNREKVAALKAGSDRGLMSKLFRK